jgi:hypothetical protein
MPYVLTSTRHLTSMVQYMYDNPTTRTEHGGGTPAGDEGLIFLARACGARDGALRAPPLRRAARPATYGATFAFRPHAATFGKTSAKVVLGPST